MHEIYISPEAKNDLLEIKEYISINLSNHQASVKLISNIMEKIKALAEYPKIGAPLSSVVDIKTNYRFLVCNNYLVFYKLEDKTIFILRIIYSKRDYLLILFGD